MSGLFGRICAEKKVLSGTLRGGDKKISGTVPGTLIFHYSDSLPEYAGPYEVTPDVEAQTMETSGYRMKENVIIKEIPIYEVSNNSGGTTVIIGGL